MSFLEVLEKYNNIVNDFIWTKVGVWLLIITGMYLGRIGPISMALFFTNAKEKPDMSPVTKG